MTVPAGTETAANSRTRFPNSGTFDCFPRSTVSGRGWIFPAMFLCSTEPCCSRRNSGRKLLSWCDGSFAEARCWEPTSARSFSWLALPASAHPRLSLSTSCRLQEGVFLPPETPHLNLPCHHDWLKLRFSHPPAAPSCFLCYRRAGQPAQGTAPAKHRPQSSSPQKASLHVSPLLAQGEGWGCTAERSPLPSSSMI